MVMTEGQAILLQVATSGKQVRDLLEERAVYQSMAEKITASFSLAPAHTNDDVNKSKWALKVVELDKQIRKEKRNQKNIINRAMLVISVLPTSRLQLIFYRRYVLDEPWAEVLNHLQKADDDVRVQSVRTLMRLHSDGLEALSDYETQGETIYSVDGKGNSTTSTKSA